MSQLKPQRQLQPPLPLPARRLWEIFLLALFASFLFDHLAFEWLPDRRPKIIETDTHKVVFHNTKDKHSLFRIAGYLPSWFLIAGALWLCGARAGSPNLRLGRGQLFSYLILAPLIAGAAAAILKVLVRRKRMVPDDYTTFDFRPLFERTFDGGGLSFPSEHAAVALGGSIALATAFPRASAIFMFWGLGCAYGRIAARDHYFSDTVGSFILAYLTCHYLIMLFNRLSRPSQAA